MTTQKIVGNLAKVDFSGFYGSIFSMLSWKLSWTTGFDCMWLDDNQKNVVSMPAKIKIQILLVFRLTQL